MSAQRLVDPLPAPTPLTARRQRILDGLAAHIATHHRAPTVRELRDELGMSSTGLLHYHLEALEAQGYIVREYKAWRGVRLTEASGALPPCTCSCSCPGCPCREQAGQEQTS